MCQKERMIIVLSIYHLEYGPKNFPPLKWTKWSGLSAVQTSVSQAISLIYFLKFCFEVNTVKKINSALQFLSAFFNSKTLSSLKNCKAQLIFVTVST